MFEANIKRRPQNQKVQYQIDAVRASGELRIGKTSWLTDVLEQKKPSFVQWPGRKIFRRSAGDDSVSRDQDERPVLHQYDPGMSVQSLVQVVMSDE